MDIEKRTEEIWEKLANETLEKEIIEFNKRCYDNDIPKHLYAKMVSNENFIFYDVDADNTKVPTGDSCYIASHTQSFDFIKKKEIGNSSLFAEAHPDCPFKTTDENGETLSEDAICNEILVKYSDVIKDDMFTKSPKFKQWQKNMVDMTIFGIKDTMSQYIATNLELTEKVKNIGKINQNEPDR